MARYDADTASVHIFTFKEGMLSAVAHDLHLKATRFVIDEDGASVSAEVETGSLKVVSPVKNGIDAPDLLPAFTYGEIEKNLHRTLESARFGVTKFVARSVTPETVTGDLTLHGVTRSATFAIKPVENRRVITCTIDQRDFRITPFSAMLGTLKVQPHVRIEVDVPGAGK